MLALGAGIYAWPSVDIRPENRHHFYGETVRHGKSEALTRARDGGIPLDSIAKTPSWPVVFSLRDFVLGDAW